jgi:hypothetical protein
LQEQTFSTPTPVINSNRSDVVAMAREEIALPVKSDSSKRPSKLSKSEPIIPLVNCLIPKKGRQPEAIYRWNSTSRSLEVAAQIVGNRT